MAAWQFDLTLIPREKLISMFSRVPEYVSEELEATDWWEGVEAPRDYMASLDALLPKFPSWHEHLVNWGSENGHRIDCWLNEAGGLQNLFIRIDVSADYTEFARALADLGRRWDCLILLYPELELIEPDGSNLIQRVKESRASAFVRDPKLFLQNLRNEKPN